MGVMAPAFNESLQNIANAYFRKLSAILMALYPAQIPNNFKLMMLVAFILLLFVIIGNHF